jgi:hypothetical protein
MTDKESMFDAPCTPGSAVDWYLSRMKASGITEAVAQRCGLTLEMGDDNTYINIPYFTVDGIETTHRRQRNREEAYVRERGQSTGNFAGKYTQKKGSKNHVYWPPVINQRLSFNNPLCPMLVCEGEFKSIAGMMSAIASGTPMLVAGIPGTRLCDSVIADLNNVNCIGPDDVRRVVYIAADWNGRGRSKESSAALEYDLKKLFQALGAHVIMLRWPLDEGQEAKEQKLDDWLVAGGDLSQALRLSLDHDKAIDTDISALWDYFNSNYAICHGNYIPLRNPSQKYSVSNFLVMEASKSLQVSAKKILNASQVWGLQPPADRNVIDGYAFVPAPLGVAPERYVWEEGRRMLNTAPEEVFVSPFGDVVTDADVAPFVKLVERLAQEASGWLLNYIAHTAQHPTLRGQHVVIFRDEGGTGKSALFDTLDQVFGKYSGPVGSGMTSSFNAGMEHLVFAHWSDPVIHGALDRDLESALKNFSGDKLIEINHKGGAKYHVRNYGRLLIATNKDWIVPISKEERRYVVLGGLTPLSHSEWSEYNSWLTNGGVAKLREFLVERDLSGFSIDAPGPRTAHRSAMEKASALPLVRMLDHEPFIDKDVWKAEMIRATYKDQTGKNLTSEGVGSQLTKHGCLQRIIKSEGKAYRYYALRNFAKWELADNGAWREEDGGLSTKF